MWTLALALVDGWQRGVVERLSSGEEYLHDVPRVDDVREMLATFADHILTTSRCTGPRTSAPIRPACCWSTSSWTGSAWAVAGPPGW